jgi:hypothetical protein
MVGIEATSVALPETFQHSLLPKERGSFRLIQVKPDLSVDGLPDCHLQNALVQDSNYVCLSYTWGQPGDECPIQLNGKLCHVRRNLYDFLQVARKRLTFCALWIDALCINQTNVEERNHQVQQMGNIFAGAKMVVAWLGESILAQVLIRAVESEYSRQTWSTWEEFYHSKRDVKDADSRSSDSTLDTNSHSIRPYHSLEAKGFLPPYDGQAKNCPFSGSHCDHVAKNAYWKRAWVTQEILLARALVVMAGEDAIDFASLAHACSYATDTVTSTPLKEYASLMLEQKSYHIEDSLSGAVVLSGKWESTWGLLKLLKHFSGKCCALRRDRIYSLLALCTGGEKIRVDYDGPDIELIMQVIDACKDQMCFCSVATVARVIKGRGYPCLNKEDYVVPVAHVFKLRAYSSDLEVCPSCCQPMPRSDGKQQFAAYFCLQCNSDICGDWQGHLFWGNSHYDETTDPSGLNDILWFAKKDIRNSRILCRRGQGVDITREGSDDIYALRFSLGALVDVMYESFKDEQLSFSSHVCRRVRGPGIFGTEQ